MKKCMKKCIKKLSQMNSERRCVSCRIMKTKSELIRITRFKNEFELDLIGNKPGRGAYVCKTEPCLIKIKKKKSFEASFKSKVPQEIYDILEDITMN